MMRVAAARAAGRPAATASGSASAAGAARDLLAAAPRSAARWRSKPRRSSSASAPSRYGARRRPQRACPVGRSSSRHHLPAARAASRSFSSPSRMRPLTVPIGVVEHLGDLGVREAAEVGELDHPALLVGQRRRARRGPRAPPRGAPTSTSVRSRGLEALLDALVARAPACRARPTRRSASIARLWTMPSTHVRTLPRARS